MNAVLACVALGASLHAGERPGADLHSVSVAFAKKNPVLRDVRLVAKKPIDGSYSLLTATASGNPQRPEYWFGVFVVYGDANQVYMVLDAGPAPQCCGPEAGAATDRTAYVEWIGDYGFYGGTYKYVYDLGRRHAAERFAYRRFSVRGLRTRGSVVSFAGAYAGEAQIEPMGEGSPVALEWDGARWRARDLPREAAGELTGDADAGAAVPDRVVNAVPRLPNGQAPQANHFVRAGPSWLYVPESDVAGYGKQKSGVYVVDGKSPAKFYPAPRPTLGLYKKLRADVGRVSFLPGPAGEENLETAIGPFAFDGEKLWFANSFYDGEGISGVGALGSFDVESRRYEMRYLPEIAPWSASVLVLDGPHVWVGLMRQPEGSAYGAGVLRIEKHSGAVRSYPVNDYVSVLHFAGPIRYFGTSHGVYTLDTRTDTLTHVRVEPGKRGKREVVEVPVPVP